MRDGPDDRRLPSDRRYPDDPQPDAVGIITDEGRSLPTPRCSLAGSPIRSHQRCLSLHPPGEYSGSADDSHGRPPAACCCREPPHLGLEHRAAWVDAESDGTITRLVSASAVDPMVTRPRRPGNPLAAWRRSPQPPSRPALAAPPTPRRRPPHPPLSVKLLGCFLDQTAQQPSQRKKGKRGRAGRGRRNAWVGGATTGS